MDATNAIIIGCWILGICFWIDLGGLFFYYWWTKRQPISRDVLKTMLFVSYMGPLNFFIGWWIDKKCKNIE